MPRPTLTTGNFPYSKDNTLPGQYMSPLTVHEGENCGWSIHDSPILRQLATLVLAIVLLFPPRTSHLVAAPVARGRLCWFSGPCYFELLWYPLEA